MARRRILITDGHPDADAARFVHALASAYAEGGAGHDIQTVRIADLDFPVLRDPKAWMEQPAPASIAAAQKQIEWAEHLVILYPLWLGDMPALLKAFLEQVLRPGFADASTPAAPWMAEATTERNCFRSTGLVR